MSSDDSFTDSESSVSDSGSYYTTGSDTTETTQTTGKGAKTAGTSKSGTTKGKKGVKGTLETKGGKSKKGSKKGKSEKGKNSKKGKNSNKGTSFTVTGAGDVSSSSGDSSAPTGTQTSESQTSTSVGSASLSVPQLSTQGSETTATKYRYGNKSASSISHSAGSTPSGVVGQSAADRKSVLTVSTRQTDTKYRYGDKSPGASSGSDASGQTDTKYRYGDKSAGENSDGLSGSRPSGPSATKYRYGDRSPGGQDGATASQSSATKYRYGNRSPGGEHNAMASQSSATKYRYGDRSPGGQDGATASQSSATKYRYGNRSPGGEHGAASSESLATKYRYGDRSPGGQDGATASESLATKYRYGDRSPRSSRVRNSEASATTSGQRDRNRPTSSVGSSGTAKFRAQGGRKKGVLPYEPSGEVRRTRYSRDLEDDFDARSSSLSFGQRPVNAQMKQTARQLGARSPYRIRELTQDHASPETGSHARLSGAQLPKYQTGGSSSSGSTLGSRTHSVGTLSVGSVPSIRQLAHNLNSLTSPRVRLQRSSIHGPLGSKGEAYASGGEQAGKGPRAEDRWCRPGWEANLDDSPALEMVGDWNQERAGVRYSTEEKHDVPERGGPRSGAYPTMESDWAQDRRTKGRDWDVLPDEYYERAGSDRDYGRPRRTLEALPPYESDKHRQFANVGYHEPASGDRYWGDDAGRPEDDLSYYEDDVQGSLRKIVTKHKQRRIQDPGVPSKRHISYERYPTPRGPDDVSVRTRRTRRSRRARRSQYASPGRDGEGSEWKGGWGGSGWRRDWGGSGEWGGGWRDYGWQEDKKVEASEKDEPLKVLPCGALVLACGATIPCSAIHPGLTSCSNIQSPCTGGSVQQPVHSITAAPSSSPVVTSSLPPVAQVPSATTTCIQAPVICSGSPMTSSITVCNPTPCGAAPPCASPLSAPAIEQMCVPQSEQPCTIRIFCKDENEANTSLPPKVEAEPPIIHYDRGFRDGRAKGFAKGQKTSVKEPERPPQVEQQHHHREVQTPRVKQHHREVQTPRMCDAEVQSVAEVKEVKKEEVSGEGPKRWVDLQQNVPPRPSRRRTRQRSSVIPHPRQVEIHPMSSRQHPSHPRRTRSAKERDVPIDYQGVQSRFEDIKLKRDFWDREYKRQIELERERGLNIMRNSVHNSDYWVAGRKNDPTHVPSRLLMPGTAGSQPPPPLIIEEHVYDEDASDYDFHACDANHHACGDVFYGNDPCYDEHCYPAIEPCDELHSCENTTPRSPSSRGHDRWSPQSCVPQSCVPSSVPCHKGEYFCEEPSDGKSQYWLPGYYAHNDCDPHLCDVPRAEMWDSTHVPRNHREELSFIDAEPDDDVEYTYDDSEYETGDNEMAPGEHEDLAYYEMEYDEEQDVGNAAYDVNACRVRQGAPHTPYDAKNSKYDTGGASRNRQRRGSQVHSTQRHSMNSGHVLTLQPSNRMAAAHSTVVPGRVARTTR